MLSLAQTTRVYLACGSTDLRKSIDGLAALVRHSFELDPFDHSLFVFCNRHADKLKILLWDHNGFWLFYRRLERGRFRWPRHDHGQALQVTPRQLAWLLDGLDLQQRQAHREVTARTLL